VIQDIGDAHDRSEDRCERSTMSDRAIAATLRDHE
jgi:hypothetical protein